MGWDRYHSATEPLPIRYRSRARPEHASRARSEPFLQQSCRQIYPCFQLPIGREMRENAENPRNSATKPLPIRYSSQSRPRLIGPLHSLCYHLRQSRKSWEFPSLFGSLRSIAVTPQFTRRWTTNSLRVVPLNGQESLGFAALSGFLPLSVNGPRTEIPRPQISLDLVGPKSDVS